MPRLIIQVWARKRFSDIDAAALVAADICEEMKESCHDNGVFRQNASLHEAGASVEKDFTSLDSAEALGKDMMEEAKEATHGRAVVGYNVVTL